MVRRAVGVELPTVYGKGLLNVEERSWCCKYDGTDTGNVEDVVGSYEKHVMASGISTVRAQPL
jgi:hypothetical protein